MSTFSDNLKRLRQLKDLNQADVAEQISTSLTQVRRWESGQTSPSIDNAALLAKAYGVSLDELYGISNQNDHKLDLSGLTDKQAKMIADLLDCFLNG